MDVKIKEFDAYNEARNFISRLCESYSVILDQSLISGDAEVELKQLDEIHRASIDYEYPYEYWIAIRSRGVEGNEYKHPIKEKIAKLNDECLCVIKVMRKEESFVVIYKQNQLNF